MSVSLNSKSDSTSQRKVEEVADLSLNQDEVLDLEMALGALGGLRHSRACDAEERSNRRYDERQHRLHESRMKDFGMEGEEKEPEADDMSQQVLIRSPVIHNHHYGEQKQEPTAPASPTAPVTQPTATASSIPAWAKTLALLLGTGGLAGIGVSQLLPDGIPTAPFIDTDTDTRSGIGLVPPGPPVSKASP